MSLNMTILTASLSLITIARMRPSMSCPSMIFHDHLWSSMETLSTNANLKLLFELDMIESKV